MKSISLRLLIILNVFAVVIALTLNFLAISLPINNKTTAELSDFYPNYFVPAGFTFSIWGIIYLLMIGFMVYQGWQYKSHQNRTNEIIQKIGVWFFISGLANAFWILAWHYEQIALSLIIMGTLLGSLLKIYNILHQNRPHTFHDNLFISLFFSVYLGWISVATLANVTTYLVHIGWSGNPLDGYIWAMILVSLATILGIIMIYKKQDIAFAMVIIWALYGIYSKQSSGIEYTSASVALVAKYGMTLLSIYSVLNIVGKRTYFNN